MSNTNAGGCRCVVFMTEIHRGFSEVITFGKVKNKMEYSCPFRERMLQSWKFQWILKLQKNFYT